MIKISPSGFNLKAKILWSGLFCLSLGIFCLTAFQLTAFSFQQFLILAVALGVSAIINQHQIKVPRTSANFSASELVVFWGTIWLGVPGGVLLAAGASLAKFGTARKRRAQWLFGAFVNVSAAFACANVFYSALRYFAGLQFNFADEKPVAWHALLGAAALMAVTHYVVSSTLNAIFLKLENRSSIAEFWKKNFLWTAAAYPLSFAGAFLLHYLFLEFGLPFGLVVLPVTIVSHLAYQIYIKKLEQKTKEIREASRIHLATVEALATAIDARDQVGVGHVRRTQIYAVGLGEILGLTGEEIQALNTGALLHDIGKLAVPDHILNKPGRLTPAEMEKSKVHALVGASILGKVNFTYPVIPTVKYHHEFWDGSGYPEGLRGNDIPLTARILSVADAYDTLRGARPYRAAVSRDEARKFLINGAGTQFDPKVVDLFLRNLRKFELQVESEGLSYPEENPSDDELLIYHANDDSKNYVEQIKRANREIYTLYELARVFSTSLNLQDTLSLFAEKIGELAPFDTCVVYIFDETRNEAKALYTEGKNAAALLNRSVKPGEGATGYVLKKRLPVCNVNPGLDFSFCQLEFIQEYSAMASLPLVADEKLLGAVSIYSCALESYEDEHLRLLETISRIASDAISKSIYHAETETRALTDPMTGLPNARSLQIQFEKETARASRHHSSFQVLMLDLDGFKAVNDTFGHKTGDKLLKELSRVMRGLLRDYDFLARYAGDEFVAIIPETDNISVEDLCLRIEKSVNDFVLPIGDGRFARVGVSIGAASYPKNGESLDQMIISADKAMYRVKAHRKQNFARNLEQLREKEEIQTAAPPAESLIAPPAKVQAETNPLQPAETEVSPTQDVVSETNPESFVVELDESHIVSSAIN